MLSNIINDGIFKEQLLSDSRYHKCHENAINVARALHEDDKKIGYVIGGQCKENEVDYYHHSWVEIGNNVIDSTHNIIMNKEKYYKLFETEVISKTSIYELEEIIQFIIYEGELEIYQPFEIIYFGKEFMKELKKNEKIFKKS